MTNSPRLFRLNIEVGDVDRASQFYGKLLGREIRADIGSRFYIKAGEVTLQVVKADQPHAAAKALYFATEDLNGVHARAIDLSCRARRRSAPVFRS